MIQETEGRIITRTSIVIMIWNVFLAVIKLLAGILGKSSAMISDAVNSISDISTNVVVMISGRFSHKGRDDDHPYGHEKFDSMVSILLGVAIIITAFEIGKAAVLLLWGYFFQNQSIAPPHYIALFVAVATIVIKEFLYHYTKRNAKRAASPSLDAQAIDHRGDEIASAGAFIGIGGSILGIAFMEPIASLVICGFVMRLGIRVIMTGISQVVDQSAQQKTIDDIVAIVLSHEEIQKLDVCRTRQFGMKIYVDLEIQVNPNLPLFEAHEIGERLHDEIEEKIPDVIHCMIHINPGIEK